MRLCRPTQRDGARRCLPEIEMPAKQVVVHRGPVGGRVPAAASGDPRQQQDHQQTEQRMFGGPSSIVPEVGKGLADVHKHALVSTQIEGCRRRNLVVVLRGSQHIVGWIMDPSSNRMAFYYKAMRRPCPARSCSAGSRYSARSSGSACKAG